MEVFCHQAESWTGQAASADYRGGWRTFLQVVRELLDSRDTSAARAGYIRFAWALEVTWTVESVTGERLAVEEVVDIVDVLHGQAFHPPRDWFAAV